MSEIVQRIRERLFELQDKEYAQFQRKLIPNVEPETIIGVRTPELRKLAKEAARLPGIDEFLKVLPHDYFEEYNLHGFLIEGMKDYGKCMEELNAFLPFVDNWATCDLVSPKVFKKHLPELIGQIRIWMVSKEAYTVRFGMEALMRYYLDDAFLPEYLELAAGIRSEEYYVNMMTAWFFATALAKQYEAAIPYIEQQRLDEWTHNKAIQKAIESYRVTDEQKAYLRTLKKKTHAGRKDASHEKSGKR